MIINHLDLFSGIGGFALAAKWAGFQTVALCEKDLFCQQVLRRHWPEVICYDDVKTLKYIVPGGVDLITAGFPCQPFSVAGKKKGINDDRYLWPDTFRIIRETEAPWILLENVPGILSHLDAILEDLENEGYEWQAYLIPASGVGAPHKRERLWIIANRHSIRCNDGSNHRKKRYLHVNWEQYVTTLQSEWSQFIPQSWKTFNAEDWLGFASDANSEQCHQGKEHQETESERSERSQFARKTGIDPATFGWEKDQPPIPGVDDGIPNRVDRNKSLGNAIVPQVALPFMKIIYSIEKEIHDMNESDKNRREVIANDNDIKRQVPGITTAKEKREPNSELKNQELFYRAINR